MAKAKSHPALTRYYEPSINWSITHKVLRAKHIQGGDKSIADGKKLLNDFIKFLQSQQKEYGGGGGACGCC